MPFEQKDWKSLSKCQNLQAFVADASPQELASTSWYSLGEELQKELKLHFGSVYRARSFWEKERGKIKKLFGLIERVNSKASAISAKMKADTEPSS